MRCAWPRVILGPCQEFDKMDAASVAETHYRCVNCLAPAHQPRMRVGHMLLVERVYLIPDCSVRIGQ